MGNDKDQLIQSIHNKQTSLAYVEEELDKTRGDLTTSLMIKASLEESKSSHQSALEKVLWGFGSSALGFGVATEALGDAASVAAIKSNVIGDRVSLFEKQAAMQRLMGRQNLCWTGKGRNPLSRWPLFKTSLPLLAGAAATLGLVELTKGVGSAPAQDLNPMASAGIGGERLSKEYSDEELSAMSLEDLKRIEGEIQGQLSESRRIKPELESELKKARTEVMLRQMGRSSKGDLAGIQDAELQAMAQKVIANGGGREDPSFLGKLGIWDGLGIYAGFGFGTKVLHGLYDGLAPWRPFVKSGLEKLSSQAEKDAEETVERLTAEGVLKSCQPEASESKETATAKEEAKVPNAVPLSEFTEADFLSYVEAWASPDSVESVNWNSIPEALAPFFSPYQYTSPSMAERAPWNERLNDAADALAKRYAGNADEDRLIRESVGNIADAFRHRGYSHGTDISLLQWTMQAYVNNLETGFVPAKEEVETLLALTSTDRLENGVVAAYFRIQHIAHGKAGAADLSFEQARQSYWREIDSWIASDAKSAAFDANGLRPAKTHDWKANEGMTYDEGGNLYFMDKITGKVGSRVYVNQSGDYVTADGTRPSVTLWLPFPDLGAFSMAADAVGEAASSGAAAVREIASGARLVTAGAQ